MNFNFYRPTEVSHLALILRPFAIGANSSMRGCRYSTCPAFLMSSKASFAASMGDDRLRGGTSDCSRLGYGYEGFGRIVKESSRVIFVIHGSNFVFIAAG